MQNENPQAAARRLAQTVIVKGYKPEALHAYHDQEGTPLYWRIRLKHPQTQAKWIRPMHQNKQQTFVFGEPYFPHKKPLYGLPAILQNPQAVMWIVEGEWCADQLTELGMIAITSGSADSVSTADWQPLTNRNVIIWPDNPQRVKDGFIHPLPTARSANCRGYAARGQNVDKSLKRYHPQEIFSEILVITPSEDQTVFPI